MAICPATLKVCIDDLCYGGGCLRLPGYPILIECNGCGKLVGIDGTDPNDDCECDESESWEPIADDDNDPRSR